MTGFTVEDNSYLECVIKPDAEPEMDGNIVYDCKVFTMVDLMRARETPLGQLRRVYVTQEKPRKDDFKIFTRYFNKEKGFNDLGQFSVNLQEGLECDVKEVNDDKVLSCEMPRKRSSKARK